MEVVSLLTLVYCLLGRVKSANDLSVPKAESLSDAPSSYLRINTEVSRIQVVSYSFKDWSLFGQDIGDRWSQDSNISLRGANNLWLCFLISHIERGSIKQ